MRCLLPSLALLLALAPPAAAQEPAKDAAGDPLPAGAKARLGTERMRNFDNYGTRLHPDGKRLIVNVRGKYSLVDPTTGDPLGVFGKGERAVTAVSGDGKRAVSASFDGFAVWEVESGKVVFEEKGRTVGYDGSLQLTADGKFLAVGGRADEKNKAKGVAVTVYDVDAQKEVAALKVAQNTSARVLLSDDGKRAVTWGYHYEPFKPGQPEPDEDKNPTKLLQFWDVAKETEVGAGRLPSGFSIASVAFSPAGDRVAASTGDGGVCLFDPATGKKVKELLGRRGVGSTLTFSPDGKALAAAAGDGAIQLWEVASGKSLGVASPPVAYDYLTVQSLAFTAPDRAVAQAQVGGAVVVWEVPSGKVISPGDGHRQSVTGVAFAADDREVISTGYYGETVRWDTAGKKLGEIRLVVPGAAAQPVISARVLIPPAGGIAVRGEGSGVGVYHLPSGGQGFSLPSPFGGEPPVGVSADGKTMAVAIPGGFAAGNKQKPGKLVVIDVPTATKTAELPLPVGTVTAVVVTPDGKRAGVFRSVPADKGETKTVFCGVDLADGKVLGESEEKGWGTVHAAAAPDNKTVLANRQGATGLVVLDLATGEKVREIKGVKSYVSAGPVFSKDGKRVAVVGDPSGTPTVTVFDWESGEATHTFKGHVRGVSSLAFSADGKTLATGSHDTTVLLWDLTKE